MDMHVFRYLNTGARVFFHMHVVNACVTVEGERGEDERGRSDLEDRGKVTAGVWRGKGWWMRGGKEGRGGT